MIEFLESLFVGCFSVFWHLTIHGVVYAVYGLVKKLQVALSGAPNKVEIKTASTKLVRENGALKQLWRLFTFCLSAPLRATKSLLKRVRIPHTQLRGLLKFSKDSKYRQQQKVNHRNASFCLLKWYLVQGVGIKNKGCRVCQVAFCDSSLFVTF